MLLRDESSQGLLSPMSDGPLGAFKSPLGAIEPHVLMAGLEGAAASWFAVVIIGNHHPLPDLPTEWSWSFAVWGLALLVGIVLGGFAVEGLAGALERLVTWRSGKLRPWYSRLVHQPPNWGPAQRWIWQSPQASDEFARRRFRLLVARNTVFVVFAFTVALAVGLPWAKPPSWICKLGIAIPAGLVTTIMFAWVWITAQQGYNRAVQDAADIEGP